MKKININKIICVVLIFMIADIKTNAIANKTYPYDEIDILISKSKKNMSLASNVVEGAAKAQEKTLNAVVSNINTMKKENMIAKNKLDIFTQRMAIFGVDTMSTPESPEMLKAYKEYKDAGGEDSYIHWKKWLLKNDDK